MVLTVGMKGKEGKKRKERKKEVVRWLGGEVVGKDTNHPTTLRQAQGRL